VPAGDKGGEERSGNLQKLAVFNSVSLDGYFVDGNGDMSWARNINKDEEWDAYGVANAKGEGLLIFGRITYELMKGYWPTPAAAQNDPIMAEQMNSRPKVVFSRTLHEATWKNTKLVKGNLTAEIRRMKAEPGPGMVILGSGSVVSQLTQDRLIDEYQIVVVPVVLGKGRTMFDGLQEKLTLKLTKSRAFGNGNVVLHYQPKAFSSDVQ
jgi:dihydrofolate reductase